jgi:hypothetical protein
MKKLIIIKELILHNIPLEIHTADEGEDPPEVAWMWLDSTFTVISDKFDLIVAEKTKKDIV